MINLLSSLEKINLKKEYHLRVLLVSLFLFALILLIALISSSPVYFALDAKYQELLTESQSATALGQKTQTDTLKAVVVDTNKKIGILNKVSRTTHATELFGEVLSLRSPNVSISSLSYENTVAPSDLPQKIASSSPRIVVSGVAMTRESLLSFVDALRQKKFFSLVDLPISSLINDMDLNYIIKIYIDPTSEIIQTK